MYLLTDKEIDSVLSNTAGAGISCGPGGLDKYKGVLQLTKTRVEELLEIDTLDYVSITDHYRFVSTRFQDYALRLSGAFLVDTPPLVIEHSVDGILTIETSVDAELGIVEGYLGAGRHTLTYTQGFEVDANGAYIGVPDWLKSIAKYVLQLHYRLTSQASATPANVSYGHLQPAILRELNARVSKRYHRPRQGVEFPARTVRNG